MHSRTVRKCIKILFRLQVEKQISYCEGAFAGGVVGIPAKEPCTSDILNMSLEKIECVKPAGRRAWDYLTTSTEHSAWRTTAAALEPSR